ncbi:MAG: 6-phosphogluconolactonase, partial [Pseudomonadota bacterium]
MSLEPYWIDHDTEQALAWGVAQRLAQALRWGAQAERGARLVLATGDLPLEAYRNLADAVLDWRRVTIIPSDAHWGPPNRPEASERAIGEALLRGPAAQAQLLPLLRGSEHAGEDARAA